MRCDSPPIHFTPLDSPPLFPRDRRPGHRPSSNVDTASYGIGGVRDLSQVLSRVDVDEKEDELYKQHMVIVNGWGRVYFLASHL